MGKKEYYNKGSDATDKALNLFADMMIEKISQINADWKQPWFTEGTMAWPRNLSGRDYNGMNAMMLMLHCEKEGYKNPVFATFNSLTSLNYKKDKQGQSQQIKDKDGNDLPRVTILKGEKSFPVFLTTFTVVNNETKEKIPYDDYKDLSREEQQDYSVYPKWHVYNVFNIDQSNLKETRPELYEKLTAPFQPKPANQEGQAGEAFTFEPLDQLIEQQAWVCPILPVYGNDAYYSISKDKIVIPEKRQFNDGQSFAGTAFHEMIHSTGAESRLNRLKPGAFGSKEYGREELVAELGAALLAQRYGMTKYIKDDSAAYLKGWLKDLKEDPSFIKTVLLDVKKSSAMVIEHIDGLKVSQDVSEEVKDEQAQADSATLEASEKSSEENEQRAARGFHR